MYLQFEMCVLIAQEQLSDTSYELVFDGGGVQDGICCYMVGHELVHPIFLPKDPLDGPYNLKSSAVRTSGSLLTCCGARSQGNRVWRCLMGCKRLRHSGARISLYNYLKVWKEL